MNIVTKEPIHKGWSADKKYRVTDESGASYLLRVSAAEKYEKKKMEFRLMEQVAALGVPMCRPLAFGRSEEGVWSLQSWIDGTDAEVCIPTLSPSVQYTYGRQAGEILRQIHSIPAPDNWEAWEPRFNRKLNRKIEMYTACPLKYEDGQVFIDFIEANRHLLHNRPQTYQHGDYHIGNMMVDGAGGLHIIDFNRYDFGDPWEEFNRIVWCAGVAPAFATGMVDGYFEDAVPEAFWRLLALYIASNTLSSLPWAIPFGEGEVATMCAQAAEVLQWYDRMRTPVPNWYGLKRE